MRVEALVKRLHARWSSSRVKGLINLRLSSSSSSSGTIATYARYTPLHPYQPAGGRKYHLNFLSDIKFAIYETRSSCVLVRGARGRRRRMVTVPHLTVPHLFLISPLPYSISDLTFKHPNIAKESFKLYWNAFR
ncbi:hypothetical protein Hamer_G014975 [Homarus americanus]|uniref:Uncharacterized protein n=1 Tax=Homarus americanus TaxID=6706 RepID=A0A8J5MKC9_HOMAM|nr:hypothetical protein Hamer_G014975 [Homarus americanus]